MTEEKKFVVRTRAIILNEGKLLLVKHPEDTSYAALPGGHLEWGEDIKESLEREIVEELGIKPVLGKLLYVHSFVGIRGGHSVEFFFEVTNGGDYKNIKDIESKERSHSDELAEILWVSPEDDVRILPKTVGEDFKKGEFPSKEPRFIKN